MGRKRGSNTRDESREDESEELPAIPGSEKESDERREQDIDDVLAQVGSGATVRILRINPETGSPALAGTIKAEDFTLDVLMEIYGGGRYLLKVYDGKDLVDKIPYEVDSAIPARNPRSPKGVVGSQPQNPNDILMTIMAGQADNNRRTMELMVTMMAGVTTAITGIATASRDVQGSRTDPMEMLRTAVELTRSQTPTKSAIHELKELLELRDLVQPDAPIGDDGTMAVVSKAIDTIGKIADKAPQQQRRLLNPKPAVQVAPTAALAPSQELSSMRVWVQEASPHLPMLQMQMGVLAPEKAATIISTLLSDEAFGDLVTDITDGMSTGAEVTEHTMMPFAQRTAELLQISPEHVGWLARVAAEIIVIANDELGEEEAAAEEVKV